MIAVRGTNSNGKERLDILRPGDTASHCIHTTCNSGGLKRVLDKDQDLFKEELGLIKGVDKRATPYFFKLRPIPFALRKKVVMELDRLVTKT